MNRFPCGCPRTPANTYHDTRGVARCLPCHRAYMREYMREKYERKRRERKQPAFSSDALVSAWGMRAQPRGQG